MKFVLSGYFGYGNAGDEALLEAQIRLLQEEGKRRGVSPEFTVLSHDPAETSKWLGVASVHRYDLPRVWRAIGTSDALISGGGSLLQDVTGRFGIFYYLGLLWGARMLGVPTVVFAQGIGPLIRKRHARITSKVLGRCRLLTVRDELSAETLVTLGVNHPWHVTGDPVFATKPMQSVKTTSAMRLCVNFRSWPGQWRGAVRQALTMLRDRGWEIIALPLQGNDAVVLTDVMPGESSSSVVLPATDSGEALKVIWNTVADCSVMLGMRLHAQIFAAMAGAIPVGIAYDPKVTGLFHELGLKDLLLTMDQLSAANIVDTVERAYEHRTELSALIGQRCSELRVRAALTPKLVFDALGDGGRSGR